MSIVIQALRLAVEELEFDRQCTDPYGHRREVEQALNICRAAVELLRTPPDTLAQAIAEIHDLRIRLLGNDNGEFASLPPMAEEHFIGCVAFLELSKREMTLANYCRMRGD